MTDYKALQFYFSSTDKLEIYYNEVVNGEWEDIDLKSSLKGIPNTDNDQPFEIMAESYTQFRIKENYRYIFKINSDQKIYAPKFDDAKNCSWRIIDKGIYELSVQGFLGTSSIEIQGHLIKFEIVPTKIGYDDDFKLMTKEIAEECSQLLQSWTAPTSLNYEVDKEKYKKTLLEQFIFLKHLIGNSELEAYFEAIRKSPHQKLGKENHWEPAFIAHSSNFFHDPFKYGRDWKKETNIPNEILSSRKFITFDTPPNQFVKFTFNYFRQLCEDILFEFFEPKKNIVIRSEVEDMLIELNGLLSSGFFKEISNLNRIPFDNQTLQKKFGYREILHSWLLVQMALQIKWEGRADSFSGDTRNVAKLYEYWVYFKLYNIILSFENCKLVSSQNANSAIKFSEKGLEIILQEGESSLLQFIFGEEKFGKLRLLLYFNKEFRKSGVTEQGSYSRKFRPDYSLVIIPEKLIEENTNKPQHKLEEIASEKGQIAYLHFDAKYRVDKLKEIFGDEEDETILKQKFQNKDEYKREDLYKMHTYNDAIRRTVGSYIIYPGDNENPKATFENYHEILPSVGAFLLKPNSDTNHLKKFISDCLAIQQNKFSQLYRIKYNVHSIVQEPSIFIYDKSSQSKINYDKYLLPDNETLPPEEIDVVVGYVRREDLSHLINRDYHFFHAIEKDSKTRNDFSLNILKGKYLFIYCGQKTGPFYFAGYYAAIKSIELKHKSKIPGKEKSNTEFYYYYTLESNFIKINLYHEVKCEKLFNDKINRNAIRKQLPAATKWSKIFE